MLFTDIAAGLVPGADAAAAMMSSLDRRFLVTTLVPAADSEDLGPLVVGVPLISKLLCRTRGDTGTGQDTVVGVRHAGGVGGFELRGLRLPRGVKLGARGSLLCESFFNLVPVLVLSADLFRLLLSALVPLLESC